MSQSFDLESLLDQAITMHQARDLGHAERLYQEVLDARPDHAEALSLMGLLMQDHGRPEASIDVISRAIDLDPNFADAHANLARGFNLLGQAEKAAQAARTATELDPGLGEGWLQLGRASLECHRDHDALAALRKASLHFPDSADVYAGIGFAAQNCGDQPAAADAWQKVLDLRPDSVEALVNLGAAFSQMERLDEAVDLRRRAVAIAPDDVIALGALAETLHRRGDAAECIDVSREVLARDPARPDILMILAASLRWLGRFDEAAEACENTLALSPNDDAARHLLAALRPESIDVTSVTRFMEQMDDTSLSVGVRASHGFAVARALDREGDYGGAFRAYRASNALYEAAAKATGNGFNPDEYIAYVDWVCTAFTPATFSDTRHLGNPSELPVFIVGMPRSGTTLVEQIAASHPSVFGAGERQDFGEMLKRINQIDGQKPVQHLDRHLVRGETERHLTHLRGLGGDANRVTDKMPDNIKVMGQIRVLYPNARIIVCRRDLRDICLSCITNHFGDNINWAWNMEDCANRALETDRLLNHWRAVVPGPVLEVSYEALVANMEAESRRLISFLGLDWDPACLEYHKTERQVMTASIQQVRRPIYDSSIGRWRRYEAQLGPMLRILDGRGADPKVSRSWEPPIVEYHRRGLTAIEAGDFPEAIRLLRDGVTRFPDAHDLHANLGFAYGENHDYEAAITAWRNALALRPDRPHSLVHLGTLLTKAERAADAIPILRRAIELDATQALYHKALANALWPSHDLAAARQAYSRAITLEPDDIDTLLPLGQVEMGLGLFDSAASHFRAVLALDPTRTEASLGLLAIGKPVETDELAELEVVLGDPARPEAERIWAGYAVGRARDKSEDYDGAFAAFDTANRIGRELLRRAGLDLETHAYRREIDRVTGQITEDVFRATEGWGDPSELPVFIVGLPRSGTSLVEQILASHPQVFGGGERQDIGPMIEALDNGATKAPPLGWNPALVRQEAKAEIARLRTLSGDAARITDKLPANVYLLGHIRIVLPRARFIICRRDPRDIGVSCYFNNFAEGLEWTNDLRGIAAQIQQADRIIARWRGLLPGPIMEIQYEDLVADLEGQSRRLIEFVGLEWDPVCLDFHRTERVVTTASLWQVRQKIYDSSVGKWRLYQRHLDPLLEGLRGVFPEDLHSDG